MTVELRDQPDLAERTYAALLAGLDPDEQGAPDSSEGNRLTMGLVAAGLVPTLVAITLAIVMRNPLFAIMAVTAPLMILGPALARRRTARPARERSASGVAGLPGAGRGARGPGAPGHSFRSSWDSPWGAGVLRAGAPAADLLTAAAATAALPGGPGTGPVGVGPGALGRTSAGVPGRADAAAPTRPGDLPDGCLTVVGPTRPAAALAARMLVSLHATGRGQIVTVVCDPARRAAWTWVRWLPGARLLAPTADLALEAGPGRLLVVDCADLSDLAPRLAAWHGGRPEQAAMILVVDDVASVPSWCAARALVGPVSGGGGRVVWSAPGSAPEVTPFDGVSRDWLDGYARRIAALDQRGRWTHLHRGTGHAPAATLQGEDPAARLGTTRSVTRLPRSVALTDAPGIWEVERRWRENAHTTTAQPGAGPAHEAPDALRAGIGVGQGGVGVSVDLLRDGPHALVAGTTGAGKSELLQTLILTLALSYSPDELAVALVDYKGGASFGACARLPHVVGQVTDLDPGAAERALTGLRAELRRRERLFASLGATDLATYRARRRVGAPVEQPAGGSRAEAGRSRADAGEPLPRLLIVVDEFRAMADDLPDFIPGLVRIAAQGRSLGVHLVLATQRPSGAITADMRANISLRIALRVAAAADSHDVIDAPDAALIPADLPGRAVVRRGTSAPEEVQTYFAAGHSTAAGPGVWHSPEPGRGPAAGSGETAGGWARGASIGWGDRETPTGPGGGALTDPAVALVTHAVQIAAQLAIARPRVPWSPALPTHIRWEDLPAVGTGTGSGSGSALLLGLADHPREQRHRPFGWSPSDGHLLILGRAGSGRTQTLRTLAHAAIASGRIVHLIGGGDLTAGFDLRDAHVGTSAPRTDPRRVARLLTALASADGHLSHVVVVDGLEDLLGTLGAMHRGDGLDLFLSALRDGPSRGTVFALSGGVLPSSSLAALIRQRLILSSGDKHDDAFLGVPAPLAGMGGRPGRAVLVTGDQPLQCQVARVELPAPSRDRPVAPGTWSTGAGQSRFRIDAVPFPVRAAPAPAPDPGLVLLGLGGDDASPVWVPDARSVLVCGPHGSGRTTALEQLLSTPSPGEVPVRPDGREVVPGDTVLGDTVLGVISRDPRLVRHARRLDGVPTLARLAPGPAGRFVDEVTDRLAAPDRPGPAVALRLVIDDLDAFWLACPAAAEALWALVDDSGRDHDGPDASPARDGRAGGGSMADRPTDGGPRVGGPSGSLPRIALLASATTVAAAGAFRGPLADLRAARYGVVLSPGVAGSSEIFGTDLGWHVEPEVHRPGRGVLVDGSSSTFVQVAHVP